MSDYFDTQNIHGSIQYKWTHHIIVSFLICVSFFNLPYIQNHVGHIHIILANFYFATKYQPLEYAFCCISMVNRKSTMKWNGVQDFILGFLTKIKDGWRLFKWCRVLIEC